MAWVSSLRPLVQQPRVRADLASWAAFHRHSVVSPIPNPAATAAEEAIPVATSCTAASRRPTSSSVANADVACPNTNTAPPSAPSTRPAAGAIGVASAGSGGGAGWRTRPTLPPPKYRTTVPVVIAGRWRITALRHAKSPAQKASPAQPDTSMSGVLGSGGVGADVPELDEQVARVLGSEDVVPVLYGRDPVTGGSLPGTAQRQT